MEITYLELPVYSFVLPPVEKPEMSISRLDLVQLVPVISNLHSKIQATRRPKCTSQDNTWRLGDQCDISLQSFIPGGGGCLKYPSHLDPSQVKFRCRDLTHPINNNNQFYWGRKSRKVWRGHEVTWQTHLEKHIRFP